MAVLAGDLLLPLLLVACDRSPTTISGPLPQRGYLWQRDWTPAVTAALTEAQQKMQGVVLLGVEVEWVEKRPCVVRANIAWERVKTEAVPCSIALRVAPFSGPFGPDDSALRRIADVAKSLLNEARAHRAEVQEFQLDYDCPQKNLAHYRAWLRQLRAVVHPTRFVITTLPAWLDEKEFARLVREVDGYVLQVHSVATASAGRAKLCDTRAARRWVAMAAKFHQPFSVALPTYRCTAGYNGAGKLIGVAMDSVQPSWPPETRRLDFAADADEIAALVHEWELARPTELRELLWYRIPVATDARNWRWPTLKAVMAGRNPTRRFEIVREGENPVDLSIRNAGESDDDRPETVVANWSSGELVAADALAGWNVRTQKQRAVFTVAPGHRLRMPPGAERRIGWLRYAAPVRLDLSFQNENKVVR